MLHRLSSEERAAIEAELAHAEQWARNMEDHGQHDTAFHATARRLRAVLKNDDTTADADNDNEGRMDHGE